MLTAFCTNCGKPLDPGAAFCSSCATRVEAPPAAPASTASSVPPATPPYAPGSNPSPSFSPSMPSTSAPAMAPQNQNQSRSWVGWVVGCLGAFLLVVAALIGLLVFGLLTHRMTLLVIGLGG